MRLFYQIAVMMMLNGLALADPHFTKDQVKQLAAVILNAEPEKYRNIYGQDEPSYDSKKHLWVFLNGWPRTSGDRNYIFEIREEDGYYRLGESSSSASNRFRISPNAKKRVSDLVATFKTKQKSK
jgi:hypothetical protein